LKNGGNFFDQIVVFFLLKNGNLMLIFIWVYFFIAFLYHVVGVLIKNGNLIFFVYVCGYEGSCFVVGV
jgi:hypothetical protein